MIDNLPDEIDTAPGPYPLAPDYFPTDTDRRNPFLSSPNYRTYVTEGDKKKTSDR